MTIRGHAKFLGLKPKVLLYLVLTSSYFLHVTNTLGVNDSRLWILDSGFWIALYCIFFEAFSFSLLDFCSIKSINRDEITQADEKSNHKPKKRTTKQAVTPLSSVD